MSVTTCLRRARALIAGGWSEPMCQDSEGRNCHREDESVAKFSVQAALLTTSQDGPEFVAAIEAFEQIARPGDAPMLQSWLAEPKRQLAEVLRVFDIAVLRSAREVS